MYPHFIYAWVCRARPDALVHEPWGVLQGPGRRRHVGRAQRVRSESARGWRRVRLPLQHVTFGTVGTFLCFCMCALAPHSTPPVYALAPHSTPSVYALAPLEVLNSHSIHILFPHSRVCEVGSLPRCVLPYTNSVDHCEWCSKSVDNFSEQPTFIY